MTKSTGQRERRPPEMDQKIAEGIRLGMDYQEIMQYADARYDQVRRSLRAQKLKFTHEQRSSKAATLGNARKTSREATRFIEELYGQGVTYEEIRTRTSVRFGEEMLMSQVISAVNLAKQRGDAQKFSVDQLSKMHQSVHSWGSLLKLLASLSMSAIYPKGKLAADPVGKQVTILCSCHREFVASPYALLSGKVKSCGCIKSWAQREVFGFVESLGVAAFFNDRSAISPLEIDIYLPDTKTGIEYCGLYWHGESRGGEAAQRRHLEKLNACAKKHIRLLTVFADEWTFERAATEKRISDIIDKKDELTEDADLRWSRLSEEYLANGWELDATEPPRVWYFKKATDGPRMSRLCFADRFGPFRSLDDEWTFAQTHGYDRIYDCGHQ